MASSYVWNVYTFSVLNSYSAAFLGSPKCLRRLFFVDTASPNVDCTFSVISGEVMSGSDPGASMDIDWAVPASSAITCNINKCVSC